MANFFRIVILGSLLCVSSVYAEITRVSVSSSGEQGTGDFTGFLSGNRVAVTADGRFIAFDSRSNNLVEDDDNNLDDVFVHDTNTGITERVSISMDGTQGNNHSRKPAISDNGRFVVFVSQASNLVPGFINGGIGLSTYPIFYYVHDRNTSITEPLGLISLDGNGIFTSFDDGFSISADGRYVAFASRARNIVAPQNLATDIFVHDRNTGITERILKTPAGTVSTTGGADGRDVSISADGRFVAYSSWASDLVEDDTNGQQDVFVYDRNTSITERVSVTSAGEQTGVTGNSGASFSSSMSADGRYVAFDTNSSGLVNDDRDSLTDAFVHDRNTGITEMVSRSSTGESANESTFSGTISADGRFVTLGSSASNLVEGDTNNASDFFVRDRSTGITHRFSVNSMGQVANDRTGGVVSADGRSIVLSSFASNLVEGDTNDLPDVFVRQNPLVDSENVLVSVTKLINNDSRETLEKAAQLSTWTLYRQAYRVTNQSLERIYQVQVFEDGNLVCNLYGLKPGESKERCVSYETVLEGDQHTPVTVTAKVSNSQETVTANTDAYYTGLSNVSGELQLTYLVQKPGTNTNIDADSPDQAVILDSSQASVLFRVENTGEIELSNVKTYHDPVSPVNSGWELQCTLGRMEPGRVKYCGRDITLNESGLNQGNGRAQGKNAIRNSTEVINASNPTYFIVP